jgi:hypothetical protein
VVTRSSRAPWTPAISSRIRPNAGSYRFGYPVISTTPARSAAATIARPSAAEKHIGFSTNTCRPASAAASAIGAWLPEVSTSTASSG